MPSKFPCIESTLDFKLGHYYDIRLWLNEDEVPQDYARQFALRKQIMDFFNIEKPARLKVIDYLSKIPGINAFQIIENEGETRYGTVIYTVDFERDPHG